MKHVALAVGLALLAACTPPGAERAQSAFDARVDDWTRELAQDSPETATRAALSREIAGEDYEARIDDRSAAAEERRRAARVRRLAEIRAFDPASLDDADRLTHAILSEQFESGAALAEYSFGEQSGIAGHRPYVLDQQDSAFLTLPDFLDSRHAIAAFGDAENYIARLRQVGPALDAETGRAQTDAEAGIVPPDFIIDRTLESLDRAIGAPLEEQVYLTNLRAKLDALAPAPEAPAAGQPTPTPSQERRRADQIYAQAQAIVRDEIIPAHRRAAAALRALRPRATHDAGVWRLPNGDAYYRAMLRQETTTNLTPQQIHDIGLARVRALNTQAETSLRALGLTEGTVGERMAQLTADPQYRYPETDEGRAQLMADVRRRVDAIMRLAPQWFGHLPRARMEVRRVPLVAEVGTTGAYYESPALDGSHPGVYYISLRDLSEMTRIDLPTQDYHEAVPGHHFQIALAQEQQGLPLLRRLIGFNAYAEGWGLYAEQLADENNLYADDPIGRIGYLRWQLWRAARLVVDTGIHSLRWSREQAIDYMSATTGDAPAVIATEIERYAASPGQACGYELGRREIARLRDVARAQLGDRFDIRRFHDAVLLNGELPLTVLDQRIAAWIERERR
ncbi:MAG: DUF885 family protein [Hyphomonadaceae bacterium]